MEDKLTTEFLENCTEINLFVVEWGKIDDQGRHHGLGECFTTKEEAESYFAEAPNTLELFESYFTDSEGKETDTTYLRLVETTLMCGPDGAIKGRDEREIRRVTTDAAEYLKWCAPGILESSCD